MTDEEALSEANRDRDNVAEQFWSVSDIDPEFAAGFRAGLAHARTWRPLTADPASWPEEGQYVMFGAWSADGTRWISSMLTCMRADMTPTGWSWWLPLPPPPKGESK